MVSVIIELYRHSLISNLVVLLLLIPRPPMVWLRFHHRRGMNHLHRLRSIILRLGSVHRAITYIDQIPSSLPCRHRRTSAQAADPSPEFPSTASPPLPCIAGHYARATTQQPRHRAEPLQPLQKVKNKTLGDTSFFSFS